MPGRILRAMLRDLNPDERAVIERLLSQPFAGRDQLVQQAAFVRTTGLSCSCGCPSIQLQVEIPAQKASVEERVPVSGHGRDPDGNLVGVLLFVDDGVMSELEFFSYVNQVPGFPLLESLRVDEWSERDASGSRRLLNEPPAQSNC
jgi:hypothetical protein